MNKKIVKISLYNKNCTPSQVMQGNGDVILDNICISCETEESLITGEYYLDATFLVDKEGLWKNIEEESILKVQMDYGVEIFRIAKIQSSDRYIVVFARQETMYQTLHMWLEDVRPENRDGLSALNYLKENCIGSKDITFISDISKLSTAYYMDMNVYEALHTCDQSFLNRWGGEIQRRGYTLTINSKLGTHRGVQIRSRKNLTGFEANVDMDNVFTRIKPKGFDGITIDGFVDSPVINNYPHIKTTEIKYDDIKVKDPDREDDEGYNTLEDAQAELKRRAGLEFSENNIDKIKADYTINFIQLEKTEEYKDYILSERVYLGDEIDVYEENLDINLTVRVITRKYDVINQKVLEVGLSNNPIKINIPTIGDLVNKIEDIETDIIDNNNWYQEAIDNATDLIQNGLKDSYVVVRKNEILIMDTTDINTATNVWRFNKNGLGFSSTSYFGTYETAITMDGSIVGKFITGLVVNGNQINAKNLNVYNDLGVKTLEVTSGGDVNLNVNSLKILSQNVATQDYTDNSVSSAIESSKEYTDTRETEIRVDMESITQSVSSVESKITKLDTQFSDNKKNIRCNDIGMKVNYSSFGITNTGYIYIHGYMNNVAYDLGGYIYTNGKSQGINKGFVDFNSLTKDMDYYLCIELGNKNLFVAYYDSGYKYKRVIGGTDSGDLDLTKSYIAIGQCRLNSSTGSFEYSYLYSTPQKLESVIGIANVETRLKSAELKITDDAIISTVTKSDTYNGLVNRVESAEQKITPSEILNSVNTQIGNGGKINTVSTVLDKNGFTINNGSLTIKNNAGRKVLYGDTSGNLTLAGNITSGATITGGTLKSSNGDMHFNMNSGYMLLYNNGTKIGQTQKNSIAGTSIYGISNGAEYGSYATLSAKTSSTASTYSTMVTVSGADLSDANLKKGVNIGHTTYFNNWNIENPAYINNPTAIKWDNSSSKESRIYTNSNNLYLRCSNSDSETVRITCNHSTAGHKAIAHFRYNSSTNNGIDFWQNVDMHNWNIRNANISAYSIDTYDIEISSPISAYSEEGDEVKYSVTKSMIANTEHFGTGEIVNGECVIDLPTGILIGEKGYIVILTPIGKKNIWLDSKDYESFTVKGEDCTFDYLIKAHSPSIAMYRSNDGGQEAPTEEALEDIVEGKEILLES